MLPEFLQSSYARYKADTNTFATWLLKTANQCGYRPPALPDTISDSEKGKAKANATIKDLEKLAQVVAGSAVTVPKNNESHAYFITALEQICETLEWKTTQPSKHGAKQLPQTSEAQNDAADADKFLNKFAVLTVEEPQDTAAQTQPTPVESKIVKVTVDEEDGNEAANSYLSQLFFEAICLFQDMNNMRAFISKTWSEYRDKKIDLINAAVVTDTALRLAQSLMEEVEADWRTCLESSTDSAIQNIVCYFAGVTRGISVSPSTEIGLPYNKDLADVAEWCYMPTRVLLESFIFLDVHHVMRHSTLSAFGDLRMSGLRIQKTIDDYLQLSRTHPQPKFWPKEGDMEIQETGSIVKSWIIQDMFLDIRVHSGLDRSGSTPEKHALFSQHAILCGLVLFNLNLRMQFVGQKLVNQWYDVQQLAFLHNLVINFPTHKDLRWPGSRPKNASESLNRLELATCVSSATRFSRDSRRKTFHRPDGKNARMLKPTTAVVSLFFTQYCGGPEEDDAGILGIDRILDELSQKLKLESSSKELQRANPEVLQLLAFLKSKLFEEEPILMYDYFGMHKRSVELLRLIRDKEHPKFVQYFTSAYMPGESFISNIVILIHHVARGSAEVVRGRGFATGGAGVVSRIVMSVGDVMREYLKKNGDVACKELRVFCRNKKPIQDDVAYEGKSDELVDSWLFLEDVLGPKGIASLQTGISIA
ncbi:conserved hypothetical protein [Paecilomyces variotii No. 5]|uniref:DUF6604 domain-containing protein n=1 Tax=Byssochlamys spectabilis (strain No. 5 / NBRC 109023) TaxID=1356009 RepID=V5G6U1_BYSSN|nr:conserved hypothetical protein [Paecilomyces variotii No. 5]